MFNTRRTGILLLSVLGWLGGTESAGAEGFLVDPTLGSSNFTAVYDLPPIGERIVAVSSAIECLLDVDTAAGSASGRCKVPLTSITVDNEPTKTQHFQQWATNKASEPSQCFFELALQDAKVTSPAEPEQPTPFSAKGAFTICNRPRDDNRPEVITGSAIYLPPGAMEERATLRIRARIEKFNRDKYKVGPDFTPGWLSRIQKMARVVAKEGTVDVQLYARSIYVRPAAAAAAAGK
ncbi:MAG: hypothetical protein AB1405_06230 [Bdellovibrionota bacterium]